MKTFDRAMYAIFLLVLLADVARAETSLPLGGDVSSTLILRAAMQSSQKARIKPRLNAALNPAPESSAGGSVALNAVPDANAVRAELLSTYRAAYRRYVLAHASSTRGLFDGSSFALVATLAPLPAIQTMAARETDCSPDAPARQIFEHTASPAP